MNMELYNLYGKTFIEEFVKFAPEEIKLFIMFEGEIPPKLLTISNNLFILNLNSPHLFNFKNKFGKLIEPKGLNIKYEANSKGEIQKIKFVKDFRFNAMKFCFKPFSIHYVLDFIDASTDYLIWTDADLRCRDKFKVSDLIEFMPNNDEVMSYLGRNNAYSECGFLGFSIKNKNTIDYINRVVEVYETGEVFSLDQWHDSYVWDWVRTDFENKGLTKFRNISGDASNKVHVFNNTKLYKFFDHLKGAAAKIDGYTNDESMKKEIDNKMQIIV